MGFVRSKSRRDPERRGIRHADAHPACQFVVDKTDPDVSVFVLLCNKVLVSIQRYLLMWITLH